MLGSMTPRTWDQGHSQATTQTSSMTLSCLSQCQILSQSPDSRLMTDCQGLEMPQDRGLGVVTGPSGNKGSLALRAEKGSCGQREDTWKLPSSSFSVFMLTRTLPSALEQQHAGQLCACLSQITV